MKSSFCLNEEYIIALNCIFWLYYFLAVKLHTYIRTYYICHKVSIIEQLALRWHTGTVALLMKAKIINVIIMCSTLTQYWDAVIILHWHWPVS